jgi:hypothetical protein
MSRTTSPVRSLVERQSKVLRIRRSELARRCGFKNIDKGIRRIEALCGGDLDSLSAHKIVKALPIALEVGEDDVDLAVRETAYLIAQGKQIAAAEREIAWRGSFKPQAYLCGTQARPSSITMYALSGGPERWLKIPLDCSRPPVTYATQALVVVHNTPTVPFFGPTTGFIVNYTPDCAVKFDVNGDPVEILGRAYCPTQVELKIGGHRMSGDNFGRLMGFIPKEPDAVLPRC